MPTRLSGSAAETVTTSPVLGRPRCARNDSTATGNANCSPINAAHESPASNLTAIFKAPKSHEHLAPFRAGWSRA